MTVACPRSAVWFLQAHRAYNTICRFRAQLELDKEGLFKEDVDLPTLDALLAANVGNVDDHVSANERFHAPIGKG